MQSAAALPKRDTEIRDVIQGVCFLVLSTGQLLVVWSKTTRKPRKPAKVCQAGVFAARRKWKHVVHEEQVAALTRNWSGVIWGIQNTRQHLPHLHLPIVQPSTLP